MVNLAHVLLRPFPKDGDRAEKGEAELGESVEDPRRHGVLDAPADEPVASQSFEFLGEHAVRDADNSAL